MGTIKRDKIINFPVKYLPISVKSYSKDSAVKEMFADHATSQI